MPTSIILSPVADTIVAFLAANGFTGYKWARLDYDLPAGVVELPTVGRRQANSQIGSEDWDLTYEVALYFPLEEGSTDGEAAAGGVEAFIAAVDADPSLGDPQIVDDAVVTAAEPGYETDSARPMIIYTCTLELTKLVQ